MGTVVHAHQHLLVIDAGQHQDHRRVGNNQVQVVLGKVKVDSLESEVKKSASGVFYIHVWPPHDHLPLATMYWLLMITLHLRICITIFN